jgi:branched-chain amino acid aminotransferase
MVGISIPYTPLFIHQQLLSLIEAENKSIGNIKFQLVSGAAKCSFMAWFVPHSYPTVDDYQKGVNLLSFSTFRPVPGAKVLHPEMRQQMDELIKKHSVYEILMVHPDGYITEGSRSNFFMIRGKDVFTAPENDILKGITRKYVVQICEESHLSLRETRVAFTDLSQMESVFITGTSPKILPISCIDDLAFDVSHPVLRLLMDKFDELIQNHLINTPKFF